MSALAPVIPDDIDRIATDLVRTDFGVDTDPEWEMYITIARAILAERERCAQIAEGVAREASRDREIFILTGMAGLGRTIASAIRNPHLPSGAAACAADTAGASLLPAPADQFESDAATTRPEFNRPATENRSAQERSSDRSGGQFGDAPKPAHIPRADAGADITMKHTNIAGVA